MTTTRITTTRAIVLGRLRKGETLAQLAEDMGRHPDQVYAYLTSRPRHADQMLMCHRLLEAKTLRRIRRKWDEVRTDTKCEAGTVRLLDQDTDAYGRPLTAMLYGSLVEATQALTSSRNLATTPDLSQEWAVLGELAVLYCQPIRRKK